MRRNALRNRKAQKDGNGMKKRNGMEKQNEQNGGCCLAAAAEETGERTSRTRKRSPEEAKRLKNRLNRIEGQIRGIRKMVDDDAYCIDILTQAAAVRSALDGFSREILAAHMRTCVTRDIREGKDETVEELLDVLKRLM